MFLFDGAEADAPQNITEPQPAGNLQFTFIDGVLTISGTGSTEPGYAATMDYSTPAPWDDLKPYVTKVVIADDVTRLYTHGVSNYPNCTEFVMGKQVILNTVDYPFYMQNLPKLTLLKWRAAGVSNSSVSGNANAPFFSNVGTQGFKAVFENEEGTLYVPNNLFSSKPQLTELEFDIGGNIAFTNYSMNNTVYVSKITYNVAGNIYNSASSDNNMGFIDYLGRDSDSVELVIGERMSSLPASKFTGNNVTKVTIRTNNLTSTGDGAFMGNTNLTSFSLPYTCVQIGENAFKGCTALKTFTIEQSPTGDERYTIGASAFEGCTNLEAFDLSKVSDIGNKAFFDCSSFEGDIDLSNVGTINQQVFSGTDAESAPDIGAVTLKPNVTIYRYAFQYSGASLGDITVSPSNVKLNAYALEGCRVSSITINTSESINTYAFNGIQNDYAMTLMRIPGSSINDRSHIAEVTFASNYQWEGHGKSVPDSLFANATNLRTLNVNTAGLILGTSTFAGCGLTTINDLDNISTFGSRSFNNCSQLFSDLDAVTFNGKTIQNNAFANSGLHGTVTLINCSLGSGDNTVGPFSGCSISDLVVSLTESIKIANLMYGAADDFTLTIDGTLIPDVTYAEGYEGKSVSSVIIGPTVTTSDKIINFSGCTSLTSIVYNATNFSTSIYDSGCSPFKGLTQAISLIVADGVIIPPYMFAGMNIKNGLTIGDGTTVGEHAFTTSQVSSIVLEDGAILSTGAFEGSTVSSLSIGNIVWGAQLLTTEGWNTAGKEYFKDCASLSSVVFTSDALTDIGNAAFEGCSSLEGIILPSSITLMGAKAFKGAGLTSVALPSGVSQLAESVFENCTGLTAVTIPLSVTNIGPYAFSGCSELSDLQIDDWTEVDEDCYLAIGNYAFNSTAVDSLELPDRTRTIGSYAFAGIPITGLAIPQYVNSIGEYAFKDTESLITVTVGSDVASASNAFNTAGSTQGFRLILSDAVTAVPSRMFQSSKVSEIIVEGDPVLIGGSAFRDCTKLTSLPAVSYISDYAFYGCRGLTEVELTSEGRILTVDVHSFDGCSNLKIIRTVGAVSLYNYAFLNCSALQLVVLSPETTISTETFNGWTIRDSNGDILPVADMKGRAFNGNEMVLRECVAVTFDVQGHADPIDPVIVISDDGKIDEPTITNLARGYTFHNRWLCNGVEWDFENDVADYNTRLVADITPNQYTITINTSPYSVDDIVLTVIFDSSSITSFVSPTYAGHHFAGVKTSDGETLVIGSDGSLVPSVQNITDAYGNWILDDDLTLRLVMDPDIYTLTLLKADSLGAGDGYALVMYGAGIVELQHAVNAGYFADYYTALDGGYKLIDKDGNLSSGVPGLTDAEGKWISTDGNMNLYARWLKTYELNIDGGVGSTAGSASVRTMGDSMTVIAPVKTGYMVEGYYIDSGLSTKISGPDGALVNETIAGWLDAGQWNNPSEDPITIYAKWTPISYSIAFNANGGAGSMGVVTVSYDEPVAVVNAFSYTGYAFTGKWLVGTPEGDEVESPVQNLTTVDGATVTLYAQWEPISYQIKFMDNDGTSNGTTVDVVYGEQKSHNPERVGYTFSGYWAVGAVDGERISDPVTNLATVEGTVVVLYAIWDANTYDITIIGGDGSTNGTATVVFGEDHITITEVPARSGYAISGYTTAAGGLINPEGLLSGTDGEYISGGKWCKAADCSINAEWSGIEYYVVLNANYPGVESDSLPITFGTEVNSIDHPLKPIRSGYEFQGYFTVPDGEDDATMIFNSECVPQAGKAGWTDDGRWSNYSDVQTLYAHWTTASFELEIIDTENQYSATITFGGTVATNGASPIPVREGYTFGLYADQSFQTKVINFNLSTVPGVDGYTDQSGGWIHKQYGEYAGSTLYIQWVPATAPITLDKNGGSADTSAIAEYGNTQLTDYTAAVRTGYVLKGYYSDPSAGEKVVNADGTFCSDTAWTDETGAWNITDESPVTFYAKWEPITYTIKFAFNDGTFDGEFFDVNYDEEKSYIPTRAGYTFSGSWAVGSLDGDKISNPVKNLTAEAGATIILYATWDANTYNITIVGGEGAENGSATVVFGESRISIVDVPSRDGYTIWWYYTGAEGNSLISAEGNLSGTDTEFITDGKWCKAEDCSIYVQWQSIEYIIVLNANYPGVESDSIAIKFGIAVGDIAHPVKPMRSGYNFQGYFTVPDGEDNATMIFNSSCIAQGGKAGWTDDGRWSNLSEEQILYAHWAPARYSVTIIDAEAEYEVTVSFGGTSIDNNMSTPIPGKFGYTYALYADQSFQTIVVNSDRSTVPGVNGYTDQSGGWIHQVNGVYGGGTLYIKWDPVTSSITLDKNGGTADGRATAAYETSEITDYTAAVRTGYSLTGYFTHQSGGVMVMGSDGTLSPDTEWTDGTGAWTDYFGTPLTLYAQWEINEYTITFNTNGGSAVESITQEYGSAVTAPQAPTRDGYIFQRWSPAVPATMPGENMTISAVWEPIHVVEQYTITFNTNGGSAVRSITQDAGTAITAPAAPTREGYTFVGWNPALPATMPERNMTVTAVWEVIPVVPQYTITFDSNGGSAVRSITQDAGTAITAPAAPTREGYTFVGWSPTVPNTMPSEDITVTAVWAVVPDVSGETITFSDSEAETVTIDVSAIAEQISDSSVNEVDVSGDGWKMTIPKEVFSDASEHVTVKAQTLDDTARDALPDSVKQRIAGKTVYSLDLTDSNGKIDFSGKGKITVSLPYTLNDGDDPSNVKVFYINGEELVEYDATYDAENRLAVFETDHFSDWFVDVVVPSGDDEPGPTPIDGEDKSDDAGFPVWIIVVIAVVVIAAIIGVFIMMKK